MRNLFFLFCLSLIVSCISKKPQNKVVNTNLNSKKADRLFELETDTSFFEFFDKFMWDKDFQKERVLFSINLFGNKIENSNNWKHINFYSQDEFVIYLNTDSVSFIESKKNLVKNEMYFLDIINMKGQLYSFEKIENRWYLIKSTNTYKLPDNEFFSFLNKFTLDSIFQIDHISFPLDEYYLDTENDYAVVKNTFQINDWRFWNLTESNKKIVLFSNIQNDNKFRNILFRGVENGISIKLLFEKINKKWTLIRLEDYST